MNYFDRFEDELLIRDDANNYIVIRKGFIIEVNNTIINSSNSDFTLFKAHQVADELMVTPICVCDGCGECVENGLIFI